MVKKLVKYLYLRGLVSEIFSYVFMIVFIAVIIIEMLDFKSGSSSYGFAWFAFASGGALYAIQDKYFVYTLPMEKKEVIKAHAIYYSICHIKMIVFLTGLFIVGVSRMLIESFQNDYWYLGIVIAVLFVVYVALSYVATLKMSVNNAIPIDLDKKKALRSNKRLTVNIIAFSVVIIATMTAFVTPQTMFEESFSASGLLFTGVAYIVAIIALIVILVNQKHYYKKAINHIEII